MHTRRDVLICNARVAGMLAGLSLLPPVVQAAWTPAAFDAKTMAQLVKVLGHSTPVENKGVTIRAPDIAENGAVVPFGVASTLPGTKRLLMLVEKNPAVLAAMFHITDGVDANVVARVKMEQSSRVFAVAMMADGKVFFSQKNIHVILGNWSG